MRLYVATAWSNRAQAASLAAKIERLGHRITHKWWEVDASADNWAANPGSLEAAACADYRGVEEADAFVYIDHMAANAGRTELGIALGCCLDRVIVLWDEETRPNVFFFLPGVTRVQTEGAVLATLGIAGEECI
jgi:hypothetical protein